MSSAVHHTLSHALSVYMVSMLATARYASAVSARVHRRHFLSGLLAVKFGSNAVPYLLSLLLA